MLPYVPWKVTQWKDYWGASCDGARLAIMSNTVEWLFWVKFVQADGEKSLREIVTNWG